MNAPPDARDAAGPAFVRPLVLLAGVVACLLAVYLSPLRELILPSGVERLRAVFDAAGAWSPALFTLACVTGVACGVPRLAFAAVAGLLYGWALGFLLAHVGATTGNVLAFGWSRWLGRAFVVRHAGPRLGRVLDQVRRHPIGTNVLLRVCPVGSSFMVTLMFGVSPVTVGQFVVGTFVGMLPGTLALALFGGSAAHGSAATLLLGAVLMAGLLLLSRVLARRTRTADAVTADLTRGGTA